MIDQDGFWVAREVEGSVPEGPKLWWACPECLPRPEPRKGCPICEGTGQYQAPARPTIRTRLSEEDRERGAEWARTVREHYR